MKEKRKKEQSISSEEGQAFVEYMLLAVMIISSSTILFKVFPAALGEYYTYVSYFLGMPIG